MAANTDPPREEPSAGSLHFEVDCGLLFQLGEQLVAKRYVALAELIKNSYDADASRVSVEFRQVSKPGGEIVVSDDGAGMTLADIRKSWMRIATSEKAKNPLSERFHRPRAGAKGIGRFAARRLAKKLVLDSIARADDSKQSAIREHTLVAFRWNDFAIGKLVQEVPVSFKHFPDIGRGPTGVTLFLRDVRDVWTSDDIKALRNNLLRLISPLPDPKLRVRRGSSRDPSFRVEIQSKEFPELAGNLTEGFLRSAVAVLTGTLSKDGVAKYTVKFRGRRTHRLKPTTLFRKTGALTFEVHFFIYRQDLFAGLPINVRDAQTLGREQGGIHIYMDRFRVPPYGEPGDDWLKLDQDRAGRLYSTPHELRSIAEDAIRPMLALPGNNQVFGRIHLSRFKNPNLIQTLNRERLLENDAFEAMRSFVRLGIDWMTVLYARDTVRQREARRLERDSPVILLEKAQQKIADTFEGVDPSRKAQIVQAIELAKESIAQQDEEHISELSMLRVLASTGTMIVVFDHQLMGVLEGLRDSHRNLGTFVKHLANSDRLRFEKVLERLNGWIDDASHQGELLGLLLGRMARTRRRALVIKPIVESLAQAFAHYMNDTGITFQNDVPNGLRTPHMYECELSAILINLMTNALKAVRQHPVRKISVDASATADAVSIRFKDTGMGARRSRWQEYFKPFVSESEPDPLLGTGTGLGLKIVKDFVEVYGGHANFIPPTAPWTTCIEITLPKT
jgi:signal transduction histidine kinase